MKVITTLHAINGHQDAEQKEIKRACDKVTKLLEVVNAQGPDNVRNKIVSRLWLANTAGEAMVILREVLATVSFLAYQRTTLSY